MVTTSANSALSDGATTPLGAPARARSGLLFVALLIFVACLPDAMLPPTLRGLLVERLGATPSQAHWFMSINLLGAFLSIPLLGWLRRVLGPATLVALAATANAVLLALLALPISLSMAMWLRCAEGVADMTTLAVLLDLAAKAGAPAGGGRRLGVASTVLLLGLASGAAIGGLLAKEPTAVLLTGSAACALLALAALGGRRLIRSGIASCPAVESNVLRRRTGPPLWTIAVMMASDRMLAGLLTSTIPLLLASKLGWPTDRVGSMVALPLLVMALGAYPAGLLGDRIGPLFTRSVAAVIYAIAIAMIPIVAAHSAGAMLATMLCLGLAASALMPSTMTLAARTGRGALAMGTIHAAGNVGYALGIVGAGTLLGLFGGAAPGRGDYTTVVQLFALVHLVLTAVTMIESHRTRTAVIGTRSI